MSRLEASRVGVRFGAREAVVEVDFGLSSGEFVGIIGPNGAGKSTLLRALAGLLRPDSGAVVLDGKPVRDMRDDERARHIGYLAQSAEVHWPVPVERVVALGRLPYLPPWRRPATTDREAIDVAMSETGVDAFVGRPVTELSVGERTLVLLARLFATEPGLMLADEPVAGLDPAHQLDVMALLKQRAAAGQGIAVVLHDLALAARFCSRLVMLREGRVIAEGTPAEVLTAEGLARGYGVRAFIEERDGGLMVVPTERIGSDEDGRRA